MNRAKWIKAVPYLNEEKYNSYKCAPVLCVKHWPDGFETTKSRNGKIRPLHPPTIFNGVPKSEIPTPGPKPRPTSRTSFEARTRQEDELNGFNETDTISFEKLTNEIRDHKFQYGVTAFKIDDVQWIQSNEFVQGIPKFGVKIFRDLTFLTYHNGIQCRIPPLYKNNIFKFNRWSRIDVALNYLNHKDITQYERVLQEHIDAMKPIRVGKKV